MNKIKKLTALILTIVLCLGDVILGVGELKARAADLEGEKMPTDTVLYIYYNNDIQWRWNINNAGIAIGDCVHLDNKDGNNCTMKLYYAETSNNAEYYGIKYTGSGLYIDSEGDNDKEGEVLHQYKSSLKQDNQKFRFVPVAGKDDVYYILSKKGDNKGKSLYIGLEEGKSAGKDVKLVTSNTPTEWFISQSDLTSVEALKGSEKKFSKESGLMATFTPEGYLRDVNVNLPEFSVDGSDLHLYYVGTASKFELEWSTEYNGYYIVQRDLDETEHSINPNLVWDIEGATKSENAYIHMWSKKKRHPSQIWRFIPQGDNVYQIYNAYSGLYLSLEKNSDEDNVKIRQSSTPMNWEVNILNQVDQDTESTSWMSKLPNSMSLAAVNMPGTHDTGAIRMYAEDGVTSSWSWAECQQLYPDEQLNMGIRAFDVRCTTHRCLDKNNKSDPIIVHGSYTTKCKTRDNEYMRLSDIMSETKTFLEKHPTECVIMCIKADGDDDHTSVAEAVTRYVQDDEYPLWREDRIPTVGEARGKVVLLRRYNLSNYELPKKVEEWELGFNLATWDDFDYSKQKNAIEIFSKNVNNENSDITVKNKVYVQDYYKADSEDTKSEYFFSTINDATDKQLTNNAYEENGKTIQEYGYLFNYATCRDTVGRSRSTNLIIMNDEDGYVVPGNSIGIAMFNYVDCKTARKIWRTNFSNVQGTVNSTLLNEQHGISISGNIGSGVKLIVELLDEKGIEYQSLKDALKSGAPLRAWHIALVNEDGTAASWDGELTIKIKKILQEKLENMDIYYLDDTGKWNSLETAIDGDNFTFKTNKLGYFAVVQKDANGQNNENNNNGVSANSSVKTGDTTDMLTYVMVSIISGIVLTMGIMRRMKKA